MKLLDESIGSKWTDSLLQKTNASCWKTTPRKDFDEENVAKLVKSVAMLFVEMVMCIIRVIST